MGSCQAISAGDPGETAPVREIRQAILAGIRGRGHEDGPGHYVALLVSSTLCPTASDSASSPAVTAGNQATVTRIKLLRPPEILVLGQVSRLITTKEVMKVLSAKKHAKMMRQGQEIRVERHQHETTKRNLPDIRREDILVDKNDDSQRRRRRQHHPTATSTSTSPSRTPSHSATSGGGSRSWQPTLKSASPSLYKSLHWFKHIN